MVFVKKRWMVTLLLFFIVSFIFTFVVFRESVPIKFDSIKIEEYRLQEQMKGETVRQVLYNYHRASEEESGMMQFSDMPLKTEDGNEVQQPEKSFIYHKVEQGETLWKIAQRYNVSIDKIVTYNRIKNPDLIYYGSILKITSDS